MLRLRFVRAISGKEHRLLLRMIHETKEQKEIRHSDVGSLAGHKGLPYSDTALFLNNC